MNRLFSRNFSVLLAAGLCTTTLSCTADGTEKESFVESDGSATPTTLRTPAAGTSINQPAKNTLYFCPRGPLPLPPLTKPATPWVQGTTITIADIPYVEGEVTWEAEFELTVSESERHMKGNGLPNHPTGRFPVEEGTEAYNYYEPLPVDGYENAAAIPIAAYDLDISIPRNPVPNEEPTCVDSIFTGVVTQTGGTWHADVAIGDMINLLDPVAGLPMDSCWGHPYAEQYHYHGFSWKCFPDQGEPGVHSPLFGYAIDGFGVFGPLGEDGVMVDNEDLDECHGHTHEIEWDGETKKMYHYHVNNQYPYSIGCFRGTPIELPENLQH